MSKARTPTTKKINLPELLHIVLRALHTSYKARGRVSCVVSISGFVLAFLPMLVSVTLRQFTDSVQGLFEDRVELKVVLLLFALLTVLYLLQLLYNTVRSYYARVDIERITQYLKEFILRCTCTVKLKYIENYDDFSEKIKFAEDYTGTRVAASMQETAAWLQSLITFIALAVVLASINPWIILVIVITCAPSIILSYIQEKEMYKQNKKWSRTRAFIQHYYQDATRFSSLQEVRFQQIFPHIKSKWRRSVDECVKVENAFNRKYAIANSLADLFRGSVYIFILLLVAFEIYKNPTVGLGAFMLVVSVAGQMQDLTAQMFFTLAQFVSNAKYMKDFFDLENLEYEMTGTAQAQEEAFECADIRFESVDFAYPNSNNLVLKDINVSIRQGEKVAIVGKNGSGKSTFVNLLCALYELQKGTISVGGATIEQDTPRVRKAISAVFQDFGRYEDTIRFNITSSDKERSLDDTELLDLCKQTGAYEFIQERIRGLDDVVGSYSEHGNNLSGGQWQKIAITRAVYRSNAKIVVLDEPTAALDPVAEADLYRNFASLTGDKTTLLISHRLGITSIVDRILVFDDGRIVEDGSHADLMQKGGIYSKMYQSQAQWYQ